MQLVLAAGTSYFIARYGLGHPVPLLAVTVAISSLGFSRDTRPGRVASTALAMVIGVAISETMLLSFGSGTVQLSAAIAVALLLARFISPNPAFALTVAIQAVLVQMLQAPTGGDYARAVDGLVGGLVALLFTALIPRNPIKLARSDSRALFLVFKQTLGELRQVLISPDPITADQALDRIRKTQPLIDNWRSTLESAAAITKVSPFYHWAQKQIQDQQFLFTGMDLATRNLRVVTRRIDYLVKDGQPREQLAALLSKLVIAVDLLEQSVDDFSMRAKARKYLERMERQLHPDNFEPRLSLSEAVVLMQIRPMVVDLLVASGMEAERARSLLPKVD
jgi:uncharacterized membrane protein YgaE (UPF0421/DUF939 family)